MNRPLLISVFLFLPTIPLWAGQTQEEVYASWIREANANLPKNLAFLVQKDLSFGVTLYEKWDKKPPRETLLREGVPERVVSDDASGKPPDSTLHDWKAFTLGGWRLLIAHYFSEGTKDRKAENLNTRLFILKDGRWKTLWDAEECSEVRLMQPYEGVPPFILCYHSGCASGMGIDAYSLKGDGSLAQVAEWGGYYPLHFMGSFTDWNINLAFVPVEGDPYPELVQWTGVMGYPDGLEDKLKKATDYEESLSDYHLNEFDVYRWTGQKFEARGIFYRLPSQE